MYNSFIAMVFCFNINNKEIHFIAWTQKNEIKRLEKKSGKSVEGIIAVWALLLNLSLQKFLLQNAGIGNENAPIL